MSDPWMRGLSCEYTAGRDTEILKYSCESFVLSVTHADYCNPTHKPRRAGGTLTTESTIISTMILYAIHVSCATLPQLDVDVAALVCDMCMHACMGMVRHCPING